MKILITGGAGFIGLNLARELAARGHDLVLADNFARGRRDDELESFLAGGPHRLAEADLLRPGSLDSLGTDFGAVCHLAAILGVENVSRDPLAVLRDNVSMNVEVLAFARRQRNLSRFVFASTSEVYAGTLGKFGLSFPTPESTPLALPDLSAPRTSYMLSKIYGEALAAQAGVPFTVIRPHNIYGPRMGMSHVVPQLMRRIWEAADGAGVPVHSPTHRRTFCYATDAATMIAAALESPACAGGTYNVGNPEPEVTMADLGARVARTLGRAVRLTEGAVTPGSPERRQPDIQALVRDAAVRPSVTLDEGLDRTFHWYRDRGHLGPARGGPASAP